MQPTTVLDALYSQGSQGLILRVNPELPTRQGQVLEKTGTLNMHLINHLHPGCHHIAVISPPSHLLTLWKDQFLVLSVMRSAGNSASPFQIW